MERFLSVCSAISRFFPPLVGKELTDSHFDRSVRPCQRGLQLNLDTTSGAYVQTGNLVDLLRNFANVRHPSELNISNARLQGATLISFNRLLRKVRVAVDRGSGTPIDKAKVLKLTIKGGLKLVSARSHHFDVNGTQMSVEVSFNYSIADSFADIYGRFRRHSSETLTEHNSTSLIFLSSKYLVTS